MFQTAALQQMGKLKNPISDKAEKELDQARISIDILDVLHRKMKSNLTEGEERLFSTVLRDLHLNFVDEASRPGDTPGPTSSPGAPSEKPEPPDDTEKAG